MIICRLQAENYSGSGGGVPDLIVWNHEKRKAKFVEVKGPGDTLSETQKVQVVLFAGVSSFTRFFGLQLWIHWLLSFDGIVEVCHIETPAGKKGRLEKEKGKGKNGAKANVKAKGKNNLKNADGELVAESDLDEVGSEGNVDGIQESLPKRKRKSETDDHEFRPLKKGRAE